MSKQDVPPLTVPALGRATAVLDLLAAHGTPMGLAELTQRLGIPKSTLHGLCWTMAKLGLLQAEGLGFGIGPHVLGWSAAYLERNDLAHAFDRIVMAEPRLSDYSITLSRLDGSHVVYLACRNAKRPLGFTFRVGLRLPAVFSATGKAILASLKAPERAAALAGPWPEPFTAHSTQDALTFEAQVPDYQAKGYAIDIGEIRAGMTCIGVPIFAPDGRVFAGLAISMTDAEAEARGTEYFSSIIRSLAARLVHHAE